MNSPLKGMVPPPFVWTKPEDNVNVTKVHQWIKSYSEVSIEELRGADVVLFGVPLSRSSISASAASEYPEAFRRSWKGFATYNIDDDVDVSDLTVVDLGDTIQHVTDVAQCHRNIFEATQDIRKHAPVALPIAIGGDHSITAKVVQGLKGASPNQSIGILQFDTHFDLRDPEELGPANGTPIRLLIESGIIKADCVYNIGLHGFFNTKDLKEYADKVGINYRTMRHVRKRGLQIVVEEALSELAQKVDFIYVTCDMDVLDMSFAPGIPASTPGGMWTDELFEAVMLAGAHPKVGAFDIVCLDPHKDVADMTVKAGTHVFLSFMSGVLLRDGDKGK